MPKKKEKKIEKDNLQPRPPVVVVLGHVDHGKTSVLDTIRKTHIAEGESGGITQHIGAYEIEVGNPPSPKATEGQGKITFIDTPGHEAFSAMRSRGARVADIAILVVAADEGIKPQTKEAIEHIKKAGIPFVVAINKIDKPEAQPEKIKTQLLKEEVIVESMGGQVPSVNISAKMNQGIEELLEVVILVAEMQGLKFDPKKPAEGVVVEANLDPLRGPTATLLVREGILKNSDIVATGTTFGKIKILEDFQGKLLNEAGASRPVVVIGFDDVPEVGDKFVAVKDSEEAKNRVESKTRKREGAGEVLEITPDKKVINLIIRVDVKGSLEPLRECLKSIPQDEVLLRILDEKVGEITDSDVRLAESSKAIILGFRANATPIARDLAEQKQVKLMKFDIIYDLVQVVRALMSSRLEPETIRKDLGKIKILAIFRKEKDRMIVGGKVTSGEIRKGTKVDVLRNNEKIGSGKLIQLQKDKKDAEKAIVGQECGVLFQGDAAIEVGDMLEIYEEERKKREV